MTAGAKRWLSLLLIVQMILCVYKIFVLSAACSGAVGVGIDIDKFTGIAFLTAPLEVVVDRDVGHTHVEAHVLLVAVPFAERSASLVVFAERHDDTCAELP